MLLTLSVLLPLVLLSERERDDRRSRSRSRSPRRSSRSPPRDNGGGGGGGAGFQTGIACRWNERGFGFIKPEQGDEDIFCHVSAIVGGNALREGETVEFKVEYDDRRGKHRAAEVTGPAVITEDSRGGGGGGGYGGGGGGGGYGGGGGGGGY